MFTAYILQHIKQGIQWSSGSPTQELAFYLNCPGRNALQGLFLSLPGMWTSICIKPGGFTTHFLSLCLLYVFTANWFYKGEMPQHVKNQTKTTPSAPTFSTHDYAVIMQWKIRKDKNFFGSLNWVFFSSGKKQQYEYRDMPDGFCQVLLIYWKVFRQRTCIFWIWSTLHTCESLYALLRRCEEITVMQEQNHKMKNRLSTKNIKPCMFLERAFLLSM